MNIKLFWTPMLPMHWVAERDGQLFMIPVSPIGPGVWKHAQPYRGHRRGLQPVTPESLARFYDPADSAGENQAPAQ